jgi:hypothetical protein
MQTRNSRLRRTGGHLFGTRRRKVVAAAAIAALGADHVAAWTRC